MFRNYFVYNETKYYTGTIFIVKNMGKLEKASFVCYNLKNQKFIYKIKDCRWVVSEEHFYKNLVEVTNGIDKTISAPTTRQRSDFDIRSLFLGWVWYIFLMMVSLIFKEAIGLWIFISIIFFSWRARKIKKEGYYNEWKI